MAPYYFLLTPFFFPPSLPLFSSSSSLSLSLLRYQALAVLGSVQSTGTTALHSTGQKGPLLSGTPKNEEGCLLEPDVY
jgi:hypothetical protein